MLTRYLTALALLIGFAIGATRAEGETSWQPLGLCRVERVIEDSDSGQLYRVWYCDSGAIVLTPTTCQDSLLLDDPYESPACKEA